MPRRRSSGSHGGRVILVGAGPGDPELITVKGLKALREADVIVYDRLVSQELLKHASRDAELIYAGKAPGRHTLSQEEINEILVDRASRGYTVVRLKGGDPLTYGRGEEECLHVTLHGIPCTVVPGVPSYTGASAEYLIPLGARGYSRAFTVATGTIAGDKPLDVEKTARIIEASDTVVFLMAARRARSILELAVKVRGPGDYAAVVEKATLPGSNAVIGRIGDLLSRGIELAPPAILYIGGGVRWRAEKLGVEP